MKKSKSEYIGHIMLIKWRERDIPILCIDAKKHNRLDGLRLRIKRNRDFKSNPLLLFFDDNNSRVAMIDWRISFDKADIVTVFDCINVAKLRECNKKINRYKEQQQKVLRKFKAFTPNYKTSYTCTNPKPYQGGGFTPK